MDDESFAGAPDFGPPATPSRPEVAAALREIRDALESAQIPYEVRSTENPDTWSIISNDLQGYANLAFIGWDCVAGQVIYQAFDPARKQRDIREGISEDDTKSWWSPVTVDHMVMFLTGDIRTIIEKARAIGVAEIAQWTAETS